MNNPPAFPNYRSSDEHKHIQIGMTLRDYFAAKALEGFLANPDKEILALPMKNMAELCYNHSDAMLKAREQ